MSDDDISIVLQDSVSVIPVSIHGQDSIVWYKVQELRTILLNSIVQEPSLTLRSMRLADSSISGISPGSSPEGQLSEISR